MRKIIGILVCLWISVGLWAVDFQPAAFGSTSAYLHEGRGACYNPARDGATIKRGRPGGAIGEYDFHSPVGPTPWILMLLLAGGYILLKRKRLSEQK